jgi:hypothetical protein
MNFDAHCYFIYTILESCTITVHTSSLKHVPFDRLDLGLLGTNNLLSH